MSKLAPLGQPTAAQLQHLIDTAPDAVAELMKQFDCTVPPSVEALALLKQVKGEAFVDELFILLRTAGSFAAAPRAAHFTGNPIEQPGTAPQQRSKLGKTLDDIAQAAMAVDKMVNGGGAGTGTTPPTGGGTGGDGEGDSDEETPPSKRIAGLSPPVFYGGCAVLLLLLVVLLTRKK